MNLLAGLTIALRRLGSQRVLTACLFLGLLVAVTLSASIPLYADAAQSRVLQNNLAAKAAGRPPFGFLFRYIGVWHGAVGWDAYQPADAYLTGPAEHQLGLPLAGSVRHVRTDNFGLFAQPVEGAAAQGGYVRREPLGWVSVGFISGLAERIEVLEGAPPEVGSAGAASPDAGTGTSGAIPVLLSRTLAEKLGVQVGEAYTLFSETEKATLPVQVAGIWQPRDAADPAWFYEPQAFDDVLLTSEAVFVTRVAPALDSEVDQAAWYLIFDGRGLRAGDVDGFLTRLATLQAQLAALLSDISLDASPVEALQSFRQASQTLTLQLTIFSLPLLALAIYFVGLTGAMIVRRQQGEIAILRSRGASAGQVITIYVLEGLLLGLPAAALGLALARWVAQALSGVRTFLDPGVLLGRAPLPITLTLVTLTPLSIAFAVGAVVAGLLASLLPALAASRHTIVSYKQLQARSERGPWWQAAYLDLGVALLPAYGYYMLRTQGPLALPGAGAADPFANPLLFLTPALFCFALTLLCVRLYPLVMRALAAVAERLPGLPPLLAFRQLARAPGQYTGPLALLILTLSLAAFTASMALTLDEHLTAQAYYRAGADLRLAELGENTAPATGAAGLSGASGAATQPAEQGDWLFLPVSEHLQVPSVAAVARVGVFGATARLGERTEVGRLLGVDRVDFSQVAYFRPDFAGGASLGALMNELALAPHQLLASRSFLARHGLTPGDTLRLTVQIADQVTEAPFTVAGALDLWPTTYPTEGPVFVANLDYLFEQLGGLYPYDVWLRLAPEANAAQVVSGVRGLGVQVVSATDARALIAAEQARPARQGVLGILSAGFVAAAGLTVIGFLLHAVTSFRRRFIELGTLRALGLGAGQMAAFLALEQALIVLTGATVGTGLGLAASALFIPFLQIGSQTPPFVVRIAWAELSVIYVVFGAMFALASLALVALLARIRIFEAVKLGEAV